MRPILTRGEKGSETENVQFRKKWYFLLFIYCDLMKLINIKTANKYFLKENLRQQSIIETSKYNSYELS